MGVRLLVAALAGEGVIDIRDGDDLCRYGNFVALESVGVAASVVAFVVPATDFVGVFHQRFVLAERHGIEHLRAVEGVPLDDVKFFGREFARLVQDGVGNGYFADVVHGRCRADDADVVPVYRVFVAAAQEFPQEHFCDGIDMQNVQAAFAVSEFDNVAEHRHHHAVVARFFVDLAQDQVRELFLLCVETDGVVHAVHEDHFVEGSSDEVRHAKRIGAFDKRVRCFHRNHDDRNFVDPAVFIHDGKDFHAVFLWHDHVQ